MSTLLRTLVRLFPRPFRARFGQEVVEHALLDWERDRRRGPIVAARSLASTVIDIGQSALAERLQPSCPAVPAEQKGPTMSFDLDGWTGALRHALRTLRKAPTLNTRSLFLIDERNQLAGKVTIQAVAVAPPSQPLAELAGPIVATVAPVSAREEVVDLIDRYQLADLPVVDAEGVPVGVIYHADLVHAIQAEVRRGASSPQ